MKTLIIIFLLAFTACNSDDQSKTETSNEVEAAADDNKEQNDFSEWVDQKRNELKSQGLSEERMDAYIDSISKIEYFKNGVPAWYNESYKLENRRKRDSILRIEREMQ